MRNAPYRRRYRRARPGSGARAARNVANPACPFTDQGADPDPVDVGWCIRRRWRGIYSSARRAAGRPLWPGVDGFDVLMTDVLWRLSSAFPPLPPLASREGARSEDGPPDARSDRVHPPSCRIFHTPLFHQRKWAD